MEMMLMFLSRRILTSSVEKGFRTLDSLPRKMDWPEPGEKIVDWRSRDKNGVGERLWKIANILGLGHGYRLVKKKMSLIFLMVWNSCLLCVSFCFIFCFVIIWCKDNKLIIYLTRFFLLSILRPKPVT
jgi:hypothetical protein